MESRCKTFCVFLALFSFALAAEDDISSKYSFSAIVSNEIGRGDDYQLYWSVDKEKETISFAVRVRTTGWVGLGISPTGDMVNSDVVIGWVTDSGEAMLHASLRFIPYYLWLLWFYQASYDIHNARISV